MKMEHRLCATRDSVIDQVFCVTGDQVAAEDVLLSMQPTSESDAG
jgi:acetyl/propionyl-CoA carboxylase alpha subunit